MEGSPAEGIIIIKAQLGDDIRCIPVHNVDITYDELVLMMQRIFKGQLSPDEDMTIKYKDHDGDLVTITDGNDLTFALQLSHMLRITIFQTQPSEPQEQLAKNEVKSLRRELQRVRDMVNKMLDKLECRGDPAAAAPMQNGALTNTCDDSESEGQVAVCPPSKPAEESNVNAREFDPLSQTTAPKVSHPEEQSAAPVHSVPSQETASYQQPQQNFSQPQQSFNQPQQPQRQPTPQMQPPASAPQPQQPPVSNSGYYPNYPGAPPQQFQQPQPQQQPPQNFYPQGGYGQQNTMASAPPPGPTQQSFSQPPPNSTPAAGYPPMGGGYPGHPGQQPTPPPPGSGPPPPASFGAPPMMQGQPPRSALGYGRYQPGYQ